MAVVGLIAVLALSWANFIILEYGLLEVFKLETTKPFVIAGIEIAQLDILALVFSIGGPLLGMLAFKYGIRKNRLVPKRTSFQVLCWAVVLGLCLIEAFLAVARTKAMLTAGGEQPVTILFGITSIPLVFFLSLVVPLIAIIIFEAVSRYFPWMIAMAGIALLSVILCGSLIISVSAILVFFLLILVLEFPAIILAIIFSFFSKSDEVTP